MADDVRELLRGLGGVRSPRRRGRWVGRHCTLLRTVHNGSEAFNHMLAERLAMAVGIRKRFMRSAQSFKLQEINDFKAELGPIDCRAWHVYRTDGGSRRREKAMMNPHSLIVSPKERA